MKKTKTTFASLMAFAIFAAALSPDAICGEGTAAKAEACQCRAKPECGLRQDPGQPAEGMKNEEQAEVQPRTKADADEEFSESPRTVIYGPLGIVLKITEFVLEKLYIIYEG